ncbi:tyrosine-type recombinase/integrase [Kitasatospora sp. NPDC002227]|uniref:site-specific integrase n=1 Tax=Kitasatospora sp. NPDC002227 TaxID=3154773 RepID=UPI003334191B
MGIAKMFKDMTYKRCGCTEPVLRDDGSPVLTAAGKPKLRYLEKTCPELRKAGHGTWHYSFEVEQGADGKRRPRAKRGNYDTQEKAAEAAKEAWDLAQKGVNVVSQETVEQFLRRWHKAKTVELSRTTAHEYGRDIDLYLVPHLGAVRLNRLRTPHVQEMINWFADDNQRRIKHRERVEELKAASVAANAAWRAAAKAEKAEKRALWTAAREVYEAQRREVQRVTGPNTLQSLKATLRAALNDAIKQDLIVKNYASLATWPKPVKVKALVWTPPRIAFWKRTGRKPSPVMVWTTMQTAQFLDFIVDDRHFPLWHVIIFRGLRRGEAAAIRWDDIDFKAGVLHVQDQFVTVNYKVFEDTPKADSEGDVKLDRNSIQLLKQWRKLQRAERADLEEAGGVWADKENLVFTKEDGSAYHPQFFTDRWDRLVVLSGLPPVRLHDGRHGAASQAHEAGVPSKVIQKMLRHASERTTKDMYTSIMPEAEERAAEASVDLVGAALTLVRQKKAKKAKKAAKVLAGV